MHETFTFVPKARIQPKPLRGAIVEEGAVYWDGRDFQVFDGETPLKMGDGRFNSSLFVASAEHVRRDSSRVICSDENILIIGSQGQSSFYHWMVDIVPQLAAANLLFPDIKFQSIVTNATGLSFQHSSLRLIEPDINIIDISTPVIVEAPRIGFVKHSNGLGQFMPQWVVDFWRTMRQPESNQDRAKLLYVCRKEESGRALVPTEDVSAFMVERGFTNVIMEDYPLHEQFEMFAHADVIVSAHGAGLTHAMFMRPGSVLVEVFGDHMTTSFRFLAGRGGVHYLPVAMPGQFSDVHARTAEERDKSRFSNVAVDFDRLGRAIDLSLGIYSP